MRNSITIFALSGVLMAGTTGAAFAQSEAQNGPPPPPDAQAGPMHGGPGGHRAPDPDRELAHLTRKLNLTADQQTQIKPILVDRVQQMEALHSDTSMARPDKFAKMKSIHEASESKLTAVLNDSQKQQYQKMRDEQRARMQEHMHGHMDNMPPAGGPPPPPPPGQ